MGLSQSSIVLHNSEREPSSNKYYLESMVNKKILQNSNYDSSIEELKILKKFRSTTHSDLNDFLAQMHPQIFTFPINRKNKVCWYVSY